MRSLVYFCIAALIHSSEKEREFLAANLYDTAFTILTPKKTLNNPDTASKSLKSICSQTAI